ncbi:hypothetical protein KFK09_005889 [Dendrobium nobile]|uniref:Uncharacterized protein n=1 Tax=Dendrobium nobile TaxID=94219 RepID=A0A8T3BWZ5_DENNO|nr:hypothetical protein KFK09_005889 [Dendrobium nobile]
MSLLGNLMIFAVSCSYMASNANVCRNKFLQKWCLVMVNKAKIHYETFHNHQLDLVLILEAMRIIAVALSPVAPNLSWRIYAQLGFSKDEFEATTWV